MTQERYPCPCCGFLVFDEAPGSFALCPVCDWEDCAVQLGNPASGGGPNAESLADAQIETVTSYPLGVRQLDGHMRAPLFRPLSSAETQLYLTQIQAEGAFPREATKDYYWNSAPLGFETVHTMPDYYDGPRAGLANFRGTPHYYESQWDDLNDDWQDSYLLWSVPAETFTLALESWWIWLRWETAFYAGDTNQDTHPALPDERKRHDELEASLAGRFPPAPTERVAAEAKFEAPPGATRMRATFSSPPRPERYRGWRGLAVKWDPIE